MSKLTSKHRSLVIVGLTSMFEYYDSAIFIYLLPLIGASLILASDTFTNLMMSMMVLLSSILLRPIGGIVIAHFGDRFSRQKTFLFTILLMIMPTAMLACIPSASIIGYFAGILLILCRILQNIALSGEIPGAIVFGYEFEDNAFKARLNTILIASGTNVGMILAAIVYSISIKYPLIKICINTLHFEFASWRLAFALGGICALIGYCLRKYIIFDLDRLKQQLTPWQNHKVPIKALLVKYKMIILSLILISTYSSSNFSMLFFSPLYLNMFYRFKLLDVAIYTPLLVFVYTFASIIAGYYSRIFFYRKVIILLIAMHSVLLIINFALYNNFISYKELLPVIIGQIFLLGLATGNFPAIIASSFPANIRYSGVGLVYNVSFGIIAILFHVGMLYFIKQTTLIMLPLFFLIAFACVAIYIIAKSKHLAQAF